MRRSRKSDSSHPVLNTTMHADTCLRACFKRQLSHPYLLWSVAGKRHAMQSTRLQPLSSWSHCLCCVACPELEVEGQADADAQRRGLCRLRFSLPLVADHDKRVVLDIWSSHPLPASSSVSRGVVSGERRGKFVARALVYLYTVSTVA
jgi:hypothetical protein